MKFFSQIISHILIISFYGSIFSQDIQPVRLEVPADINAESFHVEILREKGVLIFYESNEVTNNKERKWFFGLFNTSLGQQWLKYIPIADKLEFVVGKQSDGMLYLLFRNATRSRNEEGSYEIVSYNLLSSTFSKISGTFPARADIAGFEAIGKTGCLALNLKQDKSDLVFIDLPTGDINPSHIRHEFDTYITRLYADKNRKKIYAGIKINRDNRYITDEIIRFSIEGKQEKVYDIQTGQGGKLLNQYVFLPEKNDGLKIFGIYDISTKRITSLRELQNTDEPKSAGMFFIQFDQGEQTAIKFYDFLGINRLYGTSQSKTPGYDNVAEEDELNNQKNLTTYFNLYDPQILKLDNQFVFSTEAYQPYYTTETRMEYDFYGRPIPSTYKVFSGYDFYDVIVVGLSDEGEMIWNNDFSISDLRTYKLNRQSVVFRDDNYISIAYVNNGKVILKTIDGHADIGTAETDIKTKFSRDRISGDNFNHIRYWYDKYFLIYGYQKLKNRTFDDKNTRTAFYVNKIAYQ
jgi:hypothetical protein